MTIAQPSRLATKRRLLSVCLASGLAVAAFGGADRSEAAGLAVPTLAAQSSLVPVQASPDTGKKAESQKKKSKRRAVRCGGPGLPDCPS